MARTVLPAKLENLESMLSFITRGAEEQGFDSKKASQIRLASEEVLVNIINYAYPDRDGHIEISYDTKDGKQLVVEITDSGIAFDPLSVEEPDVKTSVEETPIGGLGIHMVRNLMDEVSYRREQDRNILTLVKY